jgi:hypothetical protein
MRLASIQTNIIHFALLGYMLLPFQLVRNGPNNLWFIIQLYHLSELLAKQYAAIIDGVLQGIPGVTIPIYAMPKHIIPAIKNNVFFITFP